MYERALIGDTIGRFEVKRLLGEGGAGAVYLAEHTVIHTHVAIKVLTGVAAYNPEVYARFVREARATNRIVSPHVPKYFDFGQLGDQRPYAVMEYFDGETLGTYLARRGQLPLREALDILRQLADGMCAAHAVGVIHRDLKPENIFIVPKPSGGVHVVILDFGIAKLLGPSDSDVGATRAGMFIGTPHYCAPEQIAGTQITAATDVYALGVIAFELLAGQRPFDGDGLEPLSLKLAADAPSLATLCPLLPRTVIADVAAMLERSANRRIPTMEEALARIEAWRRVATPDTPTVAATSTTAPIVVVDRSRRWRYALVAGLLTAIAGFALGRGTGGEPALAAHATGLAAGPNGPLPALAQPVLLEQPPAPHAAEPPAVAPVATPPAPRKKPSAKKPSGKQPARPSTGVIVADPFE